MRKKPPEPLELLFMLADSCMAKLSPNAWKVISYVASQHLRVHPEYLERLKNPGAYHLTKDLEAVGVFDLGKVASRGIRPYRPVREGAHLPQSDSGIRFPVISLREICSGVRSGRQWRDHGTGLSNSSAAEAINEAIKAGILVRKRQTSTKGRDLASLYGIDGTTCRNWIGGGVRILPSKGGGGLRTAPGRYPIRGYVKVTPVLDRAGQQIHARQP